MAKIPFEASFVAAYQFLFRRVLSIIGTLWLPQLVMLGVCAGLLYLVVPQGWWHGQLPITNETQPNPAAVLAIMQPFLAALFPMTVLCLIFGAMMSIGVMRLALGQTERCFVFFSLGGDVWRLVAAWILSWLILMLIYALGIAGAILLPITAKPLLGGWGIFLAILFGIAAVCFLVYAAARLMFFLPAVVAAEHKTGLERSWDLGRGNFWRIAGLCVAVVLPVMIVAIVLQQIAIATPAGSAYAQWTQTYYTQLFHQHVPQMDIVGQFRAMWPLMPWFLVIGVLQSFAMHGLFGGAIAKAYQSRTGASEVQS